MNHKYMIRNIQITVNHGKILQIVKYNLLKIKHCLFIKYKNTNYK